MIYAYDKVYLRIAQRNLGEMLSYAVYDLGYELEKFYTLFLRSEYSVRFSKGDLFVITGMSGAELAIRVLDIPDDDIIMPCKIRNMYNPYHEMDISSAILKLREMSQASRAETYLKKLRKRAGISQSVLAEETGIPVKTIQQYEQRRKDINKAQAEYVVRLSKALCCEPQDILEEE